MKFLFVFVLFLSVLSANECEFDIAKSSDFDNINFKKCKSISIYIKSGTFYLKKPLMLNLSKVDGVLIQGEGIKNTKLLVENKEAAISIKLKQKDVVTKINNLSIYSHRKNISSAISIVQPNGGNQHRRNVIIKNLEIANFKNKNKLFFKNAIYLKGVWRPLIDDVFISGFYGPKAKSLSPKMKTCFHLEEVYSPSIVNSRCWSSQIGLNLVSTRNPGPEGLLVDHSKFVETLIGINIDFISTEPGGFITNNHINAKKIGIYIKNRKFFIISNNLMYMDRKSKKYTDISLMNVSKSIISNNIFHYPSKNINKNRKEIYLEKSKNNLIVNNLFTKKTEKVFGTIDKNKIQHNYVP